MAIAVDQNYDKAQRKISTANLEQFAGVDCQLLVEKETHRPIIMDGATVGGKFKCASTDELKAVETVANNAISQAYADEHYLGKTEKAVSAGTADTAGSATKATQDASGNVIADTYATKTEVTEGLAEKQPAGNYITSSQLTWNNISSKPTFATVATSGSYNDLSDKPSIPASPTAYITGSIIDTTKQAIKFSNGLIMISGKANSRFDLNITITFPYAFSNRTDYAIFLYPAVKPWSGGEVLEIKEQYKQTASAIITLEDDSHLPGTVWWLAIGK